MSPKDWADDKRIEVSVFSFLVGFFCLRFHPFPHCQLRSVWALLGAQRRLKYWWPILPRRRALQPPAPQGSVASLVRKARLFFFPPALLSASQIFAVQTNMQTRKSTAQTQAKIRRAGRYFSSLDGLLSRWRGSFFFAVPNPHIDTLWRQRGLSTHGLQTEGLDCCIFKDKYRSSLHSIFFIKSALQCYLTG